MPIKVLIVDDSIFMRTLVSDILNSAHEIKVVGVAKSGEESISKIAQLKPDCVVLDIAMPGWDGLTTLKAIMAEHPTPVVILSAHSKKDADITVKCLNAGAVSFVLKPSGEVSLDIDKVKQNLLEEVKFASQVNIEKLKVKKASPGERTSTAQRVIVIGASTGGLQVIASILSSLPADYPIPIIIVQHIPTTFFANSFAEYLNGVCDLEVKTAENGEVVKPCTAYLAPAGYQLTVERATTTGDGFDFPSSISHLPSTAIALIKCESENAIQSIDVAMESVANVYNENVLGIILSGMGRDGCKGMKLIKEHGGKTIVQDESSLVFGMPREVLDAGYSNEKLPPKDIAEAIINWSREG